MRIIKGNETGNKYGLKTVDFGITDGKKDYFYRIQSGKINNISRIAPVMILAGNEISWYDLPLEVKKLHIKYTAPFIYEQKNSYSSDFWNNIVILPTGEKFVFTV